MSEIPRYRMTNNFGELDNDNGGWIKYEDHVAAVQAAHSQPKFTVGDRVRNDMFIGTVTSIETYDDQDDEFWVSWDKGGQSQCDSRTLTLYVPLTPAELIPTLKEHEWVRGTTTYDEKPFEGTVFFAHGAVMVGLNILAPKDSPPNPHITSIERCDAPVHPRATSESAANTTKNFGSNASTKS